MNSNNGQQRIQPGGLWNSSRPQISNETQNLLKVMMQESKLTNFQRRTITDTLKNGQSLPKRVAPDFTIVEKKKDLPKKESKIIDPRKHKVSLRKYEEIVNSGAYEKSDYKPTIRKAMTDQDKDRLAKIMAFGRDIDNIAIQSNEDYEDQVPQEEPEMDRFVELQNEINERVSFLETMTNLGKRKEYEPIIKTEISQKIREMELIDKARTTELNEILKQKTNAK